jgi:hypothetical protein
MAPHDRIARHAGSFGARVMWSAAAHSSERPSPSQFPSDCSYKPNRRPDSVRSAILWPIADERAARRA